MVLGNRGRRSWKFRSGAGTALVTMLVGPLRMAAYAAPAASADKLPTDTPWALPVRLRPTKISVIDGGTDTELVGRLFDDRAASGLVTTKPVRFRLDFDAKAYIDAIAVYGKTSGALTVESEEPKGRAQILPRTGLSNGADGWNRHAIANAPVTSSITMTFEPGRGDSMLRELEIWGRPTSAPEADAALLPDTLYTGVPAGARLLPALPEEQTIALSTVSGPGLGGTFVFRVDDDPQRFERAFLVYELEGLPHFTAALRSINGRRALGRFGVSRGAKGGLQVEEIDSAWLTRGKNRVQFLPADDHDPGSYRVRNLRLVGIPARSTRLADASARGWEALRDGIEGTGWKAEAGKPAQMRDWVFAATTQPWGLDLRLPGHGAGTLTISSAGGDAKGEIVVRLDDLAAGWHRVPLDRLPPSGKLTLQLSAGKELGAAISELAIEGSALPADDAPRLTITYPLAGECVNHRVHVRGFVTPAGAEAIYADGSRMSGALASDGSFAFELSEKEAAGRDVVVEAPFASGARVRRSVSVGRCVDRPPVVVADDGRPRQPADDLGAPYGAIVKAGEAATLSFDGAKLDIPAGAVDKDVRITIRPLSTKDVAALDPGMTNVTPSRQAFRFGPLGMLFKKSIKMSVPYDRALIPSGYAERDVRTFYYDEALHRWEQVGLLGQDDRKMVAASDHFTDFINATIPMPEHPGTQSDNPTSLKNIKLADPAAGIAKIEPPVPNAMGTANLRFPIEVPPGRRGVQPDVALSYSNEGGNGWLGVGWDLKTSSIEVDTRFGVPRYDGSEVYMFDSDMLTTDPSGSGLYRRRAEGSFEIIQRSGTGPTNYTWSAKDKNGTTYTFGSISSSSSRLADPDPSRGFIFRWYLDSVTDVFGNQMTYRYTTDADPTQPWVQVYLAEIDYTSNTNTGQPASFEVTFTTDNGDRADAFSSARSGFLVLTRKLLSSIDVGMNNGLIRRYKLTYQDGVFGRKVLSSVAMVGFDGATELSRYNFGYHNASTSGGDVQVKNFFSSPVIWGTLNDESGSNMSLRSEQGLSSSDTGMKGLNVSVGIDLGFFGFHISGGLAGGDDNHHMSPLDFNGDGLPDFLDDANGVNFNSLSQGPANPERFTVAPLLFPSPPVGHANRSSWNFGGGIRIGTQNTTVNAGLDLEGDYARTSSEDDHVTIDIDGDGYPDIAQINNGSLNVLQNSGGSGQFNPLPANPSIGSAPGRSASVADWNQSSSSQTFPVDPIVRWRAPFDATGNVTITGTITKDKIVAPPTTSDGVHASLWVTHGSPSGSSASKIWEADVTDTAPFCTPSTTGDPCSGQTPPTVSNIKGGDRIYAIVDPKADPTADLVDWSPTIKYQNEYSANPLAVEAYGAPAYKFDQSTDFRAVGLPWKTWVANADGDLSLDITLDKQPMSDDVQIQLMQLPATFPSSGSVAVPGSPVDTESIPAAGGETFSHHAISGVHAGDQFVLQVLSDTQIDPGLLRISSATIKYTRFCRPVGHGNPPVCGTVDYITDPASGQPLAAKVEGDTVTLPIDVVLRPVTPHFPPHETLPFTATKSFSSPGGALTIDGTAAASFFFPATVLIQGVNKLYGKYSVPSGGSQRTQVSIPSTNPGDPIFFTVLSQTPDVPPVVTWTPTVNGQPAPVNLKYPDAQFHTLLFTQTQMPDVWAGGYHGWYAGDFDGSKTFNESLLVLPKFFTSQQGHDVFMFCAPNVQDPLTGAPRQFYACRGPSSFIQAGQISPSRAASGLGDDGQLRALRLSDTVDLNFDESVSITIGNSSGGGGVGFGAGAALGETKSTLDFLDMNGDRYPDSVANGGILYGDGTGSFPNQSAPIGIGDLRNVDSRAIRGSVGAAGNGNGSFLIHLVSPNSKLKAVISSQVGLGVDYSLSSASVDLIDINGDGLPDQVSQDPSTGAASVRLNLGYRFGPSINWTNPAWSAPQVESLDLLSPILGNGVGPQAMLVQDTAANSASVGAGVSVSDNGGASFGVSGGGGDVLTTTRTLAQIIDINGDGLPDEILREAGTNTLRVKLNLGTGFASEDKWLLSANWPDPQNSGQNLQITPDPSFGYPSQLQFITNGDGAGYDIQRGWQASLGFNVCFIFCVGINGFESSQTGWSQMEFMDIDGDGRPDHVLKLDGNPNVYAKKNLIDNVDMLETVTGTLGDTIEIGYSRAGNNVSAAQGVDMPTNHWVMTSVRTGDGRGNHYTDTIDYHLGDPHAHLPLFSGFYDRQEREDYGFGSVVVIHGQNAGVNIPGEGDGSQVEEFFYNHDFYRKGRLKAEFEVDPLGNLIRGRRIDIPDPAAPTTTSGEASSIRTGFFFPQTEDTYALLYEGRVPGDRVTVASELAASPSSFAAPKVRHESRQFDTRGNLTKYVDFGDSQLPSTEVDYAIAYTPFDSTTNITKPTDIQATSGGTMLRHRSASYVPGKGVVQSLTNFVSGGKQPGTGTPGTVYNQASSTYGFTYDPYGNLLTYTDPTGYQLQYSYDGSTRTYRTQVKDLTFGYVSAATYDQRFGVATQSTDTNNQPESYAYDMFGRLCSVRGPDDESTSTSPTIVMSYGIVPTSCPNGPATGAPFPAYAVTRHKDVQHANDPIDTVTFIDGLGRVIQTKKDIDVDANGTGTATTGMTVSGQVLFDSRGRVASQAQPAFSSAATTTFVAAGNASNPTLFAYDSVGRETSLNVPDGTASGIQTTTAYSIVASADPNNLGDGKTWLLTSVTDPNGNVHLSYGDSRGNRVAVREFNTIGTATTLTTLTTSYTYDALDQLLSVMDAKENVTSAAYDTVGQMVTLTSPDAGSTEFRYDLAGNLKEKQTAVLRAQSKVISYGYDHDRLISISYPNQANPPQITYTYGLSTETGDTNGNVAGRIKKATFESGNETRAYDHLGNVNKTVTTLNRMSTTTGLPASIAFTMKYTYDWLGRMQTMTFPNWIDQSYNILAGEGELVTYAYDHGGNIDKITGKYQTANPQQTSVPTSFNYLNHVGYDEFGERTVLVNGNGVANNYGYDPFTRRPTSIKAKSSGSLEQQQGIGPMPFHNLQYTYDKAGNITEEINNVSVQPKLNAGVFVGPLDVKYTYDDLYQLRSMSAKYRGNVAYGYQWSDTYTYDEIGNFQTKAQSQDRLVWDNQTVNTSDTNPVSTQLSGSRFDHNVSALTFSLAYKYTSGRPHAAAPVTETPAGSTASSRAYNYDANGNNTGNTFSGNNRFQVWDEENRLKEVDQNGGMLAKFLYDDGGERRKKQTSSGDAWYVNQYFVLLPNNLPTKHIFAGSERIATKTDAIYMQTPVLDYYHNDHLGTTSYLTVATQDLVQHERYFAFGGLWRPGDEQDETDLPRGSLERNWTFLGKEWDVDESLYYFGARYFDPHADVWQSPDPILASYMQKGASGATPANLGLYTYAWNNPVILRDPDGRGVQTGSSGADEATQIRIQQQTSVQAQTRAGIQEGISKWGYDPLHASVYGYLKATGQGTTYDDVNKFIAWNLIGYVPPSAGMSKSSAVLGDVLLHTAGAAIFALTGGIAGEFGVGGDATGGGLSAEQAANLGRFEKRLPSGAGPTSVHDLPGGGKAFQAEVPGRVPGSSAIYEKQVGAGGETLQFTKTTVDPSGRIVHTKNKLTGDVILPP